MDQENEGDHKHPVDVSLKHGKVIPGSSRVQMKGAGKNSQAIDDLRN
jgi:hypothetical protein